MDRENREQPGSEGDEHVRPDTGRVVVDLAFRADCAAKGGGGEEPHREVELQADVDHRALGTGMAEIIERPDGRC